MSITTTAIKEVSPLKHDGKATIKKAPPVAGG